MLTTILCSHVVGAYIGQILSKVAIILCISIVSVDGTIIASYPGPEGYEASTITQSIVAKAKG